ncbi:hypothetical protein B0H13DRAFT_2360511 [Mycena leptocephala]|nr:hypothetical protein B0H13DRAFT_2360511 [Mycena leptocephala]
MGFDSEDDAPRAPRPNYQELSTLGSRPSSFPRAMRRVSPSLLRRDGRMRYDTEICGVCGDQAALAQFRCKDCFGDTVICGGAWWSAMWKSLHRIERWNTTFFEPATLKDLAPPNFVVLHTNGIHDVAVDVCDCPIGSPLGNDEDQLLRAGWFPHRRPPSTCATLAVLDLFVLSTHQAKTTMYDFYAMLEKLTITRGVKPPNRYRVWLRMCRKYRHLLMLKRAGRGHAETGVEGTKKGELAVTCPCCRIPRSTYRGLGEWPPEKRFLYILFLALDACFRLKRRLVSSELKDPSLGPGWGYVVENAAYREHLLTVTDPKGGEQMSTCSGLAALDYANTKFSRGYSATGVGMGVCARHEFVQPNGVGDLQKGERYANMDWIFACILRHKIPVYGRSFPTTLLPVVGKFEETSEETSALVRLVLAMELMRFVIPKMHIHSTRWHASYASLSTSFLGAHRRMARVSSVRGSHQRCGDEYAGNGAGSRDDVLNCHWNFWNWQKLIGLGERLRTRQDRAKEERSGFLHGREMVELFEKDPTAKNLYAGTVGGITEAQVLLQLEEEESKRVESGVPGIHTVSPSSSSRQGLKSKISSGIEEGWDDAQQIDIVALRRKLNVSLQRLRTLQATYTPSAIVALGQREGVPEDEPPEKTPLGNGTRERPRVIEDSLRDAQCSTAIVRLRSQLHVKSRLLTYKRIQARHQGANTRSCTIVTRNETKIRLHSEKYQMAWEAKRLLANGDARKVGWRILRKEDIRCMEDPEELRRNADKQKKQQERCERREEGLREDGLLAPLTAEESGERAARGGENKKRCVLNGQNHMLERVDGARKGLGRRRGRRLPVSMEFRATEWEDRVRRIPLGVVAPDLAEGAVAYAMKQAVMYRDIAARAEISMSEVQRGRGKRATGGGGGRADVAVEGGGGREDDGMGLEDDEDELNDLRGGLSDEEFLFGEATTIERSLVWGEYGIHCCAKSQEWARMPKSTHIATADTPLAPALERPFSPFGTGASAARSERAPLNIMPQVSS